MTDTLLLNGEDRNQLGQAARIASSGGVLAVPTDTVYGLAASVLDERAIQRVFDLKKRPASQPMPVLLATARDATLVATGIPRDAWPLIDRFWPGALTLILPARRSLSRVLTGGRDTVGVRVPSGRVLLALLETVGVPLTGTSANLHGQPAAVTAQQAVAAFAGAVDAVLDDPNGQSAGIPSTMIEIRDGVFVVHRAGAVGADELRQALGPRARLQVNA